MRHPRFVPLRRRLDQIPTGARWQAANGHALVRAALGHRGFPANDAHGAIAWLAPVRRDGAARARPARWRGPHPRRPRPPTARAEFRSRSSVASPASVPAAASASAELPARCPAAALRGRAERAACRTVAPGAMAGNCGARDPASAAAGRAEAACWHLSSRILASASLAIASVLQWNDLT